MFPLNVSSYKLHSVTSQNTSFFTVTAVKTSNLTTMMMILEQIVELISGSGSGTGSTQPL
jgi:hypothetical protein